MKPIAKRCCPKAIQVTHRFHIQKLALEALQEIRIKLAKANNKQYAPEILQDGDTLKQLLARSRYLRYKSHSNWTESQKVRANILFERYPYIKIDFKLVPRTQRYPQHSNFYTSSLYKTSALVQRCRTNWIQSL